MEQPADRIDALPSSEGAPKPFAGKTQQQWKHYWDSEFEAEDKRNREFRKNSDQINRRYLDKRKDQGPQYNIGSAEFRVNLFHANTFTVMSFLYGRVPSVDATRATSSLESANRRLASTEGTRP